MMSDCIGIDVFKRPLKWIRWLILSRCHVYMASVIDKQMSLYIYMFGIRSVNTMYLM